MEVRSKSSIHSVKTKPNKKVIAGSTIGTCASVGAAIALIGKKQGYKIFKKPDFSKWNKPKDWLISKINYEEKEMIALAGSSVAGGFIGGSLFDKKENIKSKFKEGIFQMIANILVPISTVGICNKAFNKFAVPKLNIKGKKLNVLKACVTIGGLIIGIFAGNKVGNFINEKIFKSKNERKLSIKDLSAQLDDTCLAASMLTQGGGHWGKIVSRFIPIALLMPGFETGMKMSKNENNENENLNETKEKTQTLT